MTGPHQPPRPATPAAAVPHTYLGVDVGGTKIAAGLVSADGTLLTSLVRPTPAAQGPTAVLDAIAEAVRELPGPSVRRGSGHRHGRGHRPRQRGGPVRQRPASALGRHPPEQGTERPSRPVRGR
ncbi:ROK family protein [Streptomyces hygroscopicus]|uniref:ROK family protein n=1 Tax=Streptomyces hygroscopicus TaxID=1912 RepID=UPI0035575CAD